MIFQRLHAHGMLVETLCPDKGEIFAFLVSVRQASSPPQPSCEENLQVRGACDSSLPPCGCCTGEAHHWRWFYGLRLTYFFLFATCCPQTLLAHISSSRSLEPCLLQDERCLPDQQRNFKSKSVPATCFCAPFRAHATCFLVRFQVHATFFRLFLCLCACPFPVFHARARVHF